MDTTEKVFAGLGCLLIVLVDLAVPTAAIIFIVWVIRGGLS